jgi:predicted RNA binding protein YcfA (HicA-like mRNA interferase family)
VRLVEADGWKQVGQVGSHRQEEHPVKPGRVTISGKLSSEVHPTGAVRRCSDDLP